MRLIRFFFALMMTLNIVMFFVHYAYLINITDEFKGDAHKCYVNHFYDQESVKKVEKWYHGLRMVLLSMVCVSLSESTIRILLCISSPYASIHLRTELRNTMLTFCAFLICYIVWFGLYIYEFAAEFVETVEDGDKAFEFYNDQLIGMFCSGLLCSVLPILVLFYIHFQSYTSIGSLFAKATNVQQPRNSTGSTHNESSDVVGARPLRDSTASQQSNTSVKEKFIVFSDHQEDCTNSED